MTPEQIAARLVDDGEAVRKPCRHTRAWITIELAVRANPSDPLFGQNFYVTKTCEIRRGYTLRASIRVPPSFARKFTGD